MVNQRQKRGQKLDMKDTKGAEEEPQKPQEPEIRKGKFVFPDGACYEGEYIEMAGGTKLRHGCGKHVNCKEVYVGQWRHDSMHGQGELMFPSEASYRGAFESNKFCGEGVYTWSDGAHYEGGWRDNKMHGRGCYEDRENARWDGEFSNGMYDNGHAKVALR